MLVQEAVSPAARPLYSPNGCVAAPQAGFMTADKLLTVSPHYAKEIASNVAKGVELDNVIR